MNKEFSKKLVQIRKDRKLSQRALAKYSGLSSAYISQLESSARIKPSIDTLARLSKALQVDLTDLLAIAGYINKPESEIFREYLDITDLEPKFKEMARETVESYRIRQEKGKRSSA